MISGGSGPTATSCTLVARTRRSRSGAIGSSWPRSRSALEGARSEGSRRGGAGDLPADRCLVGYVLPDRGLGSTPRTPEARDLRLFLADRIPSHAIPSAFVVVEEWPVSSNGKLDRKALPPPARRYIAPRDEVERRLAEIWEETMDISSIGVNDDFFELGGYSLKAAALLSRVGEAFGVAMPQDALLRAPTIEAMAGLLAEGTPQGPPRLVVAVHGLGSKPPFFLRSRLGGPSPLDLSPLQGSRSRPAELRAPTAGGEARDLANHRGDGDSPG